MGMPSKTDYERALRSYFHKTKGYVIASVNDKLDAERDTINQYETKNEALGKDEVLRRTFLNVAGRVIGTILYCILVIFVLNEVFVLNIQISLKNVLLLTLIVFAFHTKFLLAKE
ncbi:MAG TPA: hypothetical protein VFU05_20395 [Cyclobacteriaceae bacterium]|nr:hypothetical protein [Cyclobacteriaceae bacterium]